MPRQEKKNKLTEYRKKRDFEKTPEPDDEVAPLTSTARFVVHKHHASKLHYDLRLEFRGVLKSWAVTSEPTLKPEDKKLAVLVEDHPYWYRKFEGVIPKGNYGAGPVMIWDEGNYNTLHARNKKEMEAEFEKGFKAGKITFVLNGKKLKGEFSLIRLSEIKNWILIKKRDEYADLPIARKDNSVVSNMKIEDIAGSASPLKGIELEKYPEEDPPHHLKPMLAEISEPFESPGWLYETKLDGYRAIAHKNGKDVKLMSRNQILFNSRFKEIVASLSSLPYDYVFDGELISLDDDGNISFQSLQNYMKNGIGRIRYFVFDLLHLSGRNLRETPLLERKEILRKIWQKEERIILLDYFSKNGLELFEKAVALGFEGILAKKVDSVYLPGLRSASWLKIKAYNYQEAIICGYTEPRGGRKHIGSLLLGAYEKNKLVYIGNSGGGFTEQMLADLKKELEKIVITEPPFENAPKIQKVTWVKPKMVCQIKFAEWTDEGIMRHPVFLGIRSDKTAKEVFKE